MLPKLLTSIFGSRNDRLLKQYRQVVQKVNALEASFEQLSDTELRAKTEEFRQRVGAGETLDALLPEAFAAVREASKRTLKMRHFDVQLIGGMALHAGKIAEMRTGEGKTLMATLPVYLNSLTGKGVHLVTVNDYLARRDAEWMGRLYNFMGLTVGVNTPQMSREAKQVSGKFFKSKSVSEATQSLKEGTAFRFIADSGLEATEHHEGELTENIDRSSWVSMKVQRALDDVQSRLQDGLAFLATVGSTAPFIGLFGTVWGIYNALTAIGIAGQASIDKVAGPVGGRHAREDGADLETEEAVHTTHPLRVALGEVVVDRDDVNALLGDRVEVRGQRRDQGLALAGAHLGDLAAMQDDAADQLDVVVTHPERAAPTLAERTALVKDFLGRLA